MLHAGCVLEMTGCGSTVIRLMREPIIVSESSPRSVILLSCVSLSAETRGFVVDYSLMLHRYREGNKTRVEIWWMNYAPNDLSVSNVNGSVVHEAYCRPCGQIGYGSMERRERKATFQVIVVVVDEVKHGQRRTHQRPVTAQSPNRFPKFNEIHLTIIWQ
jgi:hypothetical protein